MNNIVNQVPVLRGSREYPEDPKQFAQEVSKSYIEIANAVNQRTIGIYAVNRPVVTGNIWYLRAPGRQSTLRQVYAFTSFSSPLSIAHGISFPGIAGFAVIYGTATDGTNWYPLPFVDTTSINNQISVKVTPADIIITAGSTSPSISSGYIVLEWISLI